MNMSGNQRGLIPAFFISAVIIAEHVQMTRWRDDVKFVMTVGEFSFDVSASPRFLHYVVVAISCDAPAESEVAC